MIIDNRLYPFRPKSTGQLLPGQFWAIPLPDGNFACGRVVQIGGSEIPTKSRNFFGGLQDWLGQSPPTSQTLADTQILDYGVMHIRAITELSGEILGQRNLELDSIRVPALISAFGGAGSMILEGANSVRPARTDEWGKTSVLRFWGWDFIRKLAIDRLNKRAIDYGFANGADEQSSTV